MGTLDRFGKCNHRAPADVQWSSRRVERNRTFSASDEGRLLKVDNGAVYVQEKDTTWTERLNVAVIEVEMAIEKSAMPGQHTCRIAEVRCYSSGQAYEVVLEGLRFVNEAKAKHSAIRKNDIGKVVQIEVSGKKWTGPHGKQPMGTTLLEKVRGDDGAALSEGKALEILEGVKLTIGQEVSRVRFRFIAKKLEIGLIESLPYKPYIYEHWKRRGSFYGIRINPER